MVKEYYTKFFYFEADRKTPLNQAPLVQNNNSYFYIIPCIWSWC